MKILKIRVRSNLDGTMLYPPGFIDIRCLEHKYYDDLATGICWLYVLVKDEDLATIRDLTDVTEITAKEAEDFFVVTEPKKEVVTDEAAIRRIEIQVKAGIALSAEDLKKIDPNDPAAGIEYEKRFIDKVKIRMGL